LQAPAGELQQFSTFRKQLRKHALSHFALITPGRLVARAVSQKKHKDTVGGESRIKSKEDGHV
jgi:hypothetical protein